MNYGSLEAESVFNRGQTIYMRTWGCTHNTSDSEYMAGQLAEAGFKVRVSHVIQSDHSEILGDKVIKLFPDSIKSKRSYRDFKFRK